MSMNKRDGKAWKMPIEKHTTAAWANIKDTKPVSKVPVPTEKSVRDAKDWVDSNEK